MDFQGLLGYLALAALLGSTITAKHPRFVEKILGGTQATIRLHHQLSLLFVILGAFHVVFELLPYAVLAASLSEFLGMLFDPGDEVLFLGMASILVFWILIPLSYWVALPYGRWKKIHQWMSLGIFFACSHILASWWSTIFKWASGFFGHLNIYSLIVLFALAWTAVYLTYQKITQVLVGRFKSQLLPGHLFEIEEATHPTDNVTLLTLKTPTAADLWQPGDYGDFQFFANKNASYAQTLSHKKHPFTIYQKPTPNKLKILISPAGKDTSILQKSAVGLKGRMFGPHSSFARLDLHKPILWIAGGSGMTALLGICYHLAESHSNIIRPLNHLEVLYLTSPTQNPIFLKDLEKFKFQFPWISYTHHVSGPMNPVGIRQLLAHIPQWECRQICISGSHGMSYLWTRSLRKLGISKKNLYTEDPLCANI